MGGRITVTLNISCWHSLISSTMCWTYSEPRDCNMFVWSNELQLCVNNVILHRVVDSLQPRPAAVQDVAKAASSSRVCAFKTGKQMFHNHCSTRDSLAGTLRGSPISAAFWQKVTSEWDALPPRDRQVCIVQYLGICLPVPRALLGDCMVLRNSGLEDMINQYYLCS